MAKKLKVFVVPIGFHDAYVAAPSRKAALVAWGSEHDLFARGVAQEVTDPALTAEPLANPGAVIKRSRGTTAEQIAALPPDVERAATEEAADEPTARPRKATEKAAPKPVPAPVKVQPKPSRDALDAAEQALAEAEEAQRREEAEIAARQAALDRERRKVSESNARAQEKLAAAIAQERERYDRAIKRWREG